MLATIIAAAGDIRVEEVPDARLLAPTDAVVRVTAACVCGSDLWPYRGVTPTRSAHPIGHELVGIVEAVGADVATVAPGDFVISPFSFADGTCQACREGFPSACAHVSFFGSRDDAGLATDGAQSELARIPHADANLVAVPGPVAPELVPSLLTLADVMSTGHHAAASARVGPGDVVAVVGDGAVGLCAVLAAHRLGAARVIAFSRHPDRAALAREFGATDVIAERGEEGIAALQALLDGGLADAALECVGTSESMRQALDSVRGGGRVGFVGVPNGGAELPIRLIFGKNLTVGGGMAPARTYIPELLPDVLAGRIRPGRVFDLELPLAEAAEAYRAMDERRAIKVLLRP